MAMQVARDGNTYVVVVKPQDEDGTAVTPNSMSYTLTNEYGRIVNSKDHVVITPSTEASVVLSAADVKYAEGTRRRVILEGKYNSTLGSSMDLVDWTEFGIEDVPHVT